MMDSMEKLSGPEVGDSSVPRCKAKAAGVHLSPTRIAVALATVALLLTGAILVVYFASDKDCEKVISDGPPVEERGNETRSKEDPYWMDDVSVEQALPLDREIEKSDYNSTDLRLPTALRPYHYNLHIRPDIYHDDPADYHTTGGVAIYINVLEETDAIVLHSRVLTVREQTIRIRDVDTEDTYDWLSTDYDPVREFYFIYLAAPLAQGSRIRLAMRYDTPLRNDMAGIFFTAYRENGEDIPMVATQFAAIEARKAFPCFDQTDMKATFKVSIWRKEPYLAASNMLVRDTVTHGDWLVDRFEVTSVVMPTYLVAFSVAQYSYIEEESDSRLNTPSRILARPSTIEEGQADYALSISGPILAYYEEYFNHTYVLPKEDHLAIKDLPYGAMENWGLIIYREERLLVNPRFDTANDFYGQTAIIAHEIAHMWVGNVVTCAWWNDMFLNEGFASYYDFFGTQQVHPEWDLEQIYVYDSMRAIMRDDSQGTARALTAPVEDLQQMATVYNGLNYEKGAGVIRMMAEGVSHPVFRKAMQEYIDTFQYSVATHEDLLATVDKVAEEEGVQLPVSVTEVMLPWLRQAGFPVVTVNKTSGTEIEVTQELFLSAPYRGNSLPPSEYNYQWHLPLTYTTSQDSNTEVYALIPPQDEPVAVTISDSPSDWIIANSRYVGYYIVNYDLNNWNQLIQLINTTHQDIHVINRCQMIHDAFMLSRAEYIPQLISLQLTEYLPREEDYIPFACMEDNLPYLENLLSDDPLTEDYQSYMLSVVTPSYDRYGWEEPQDEHLFDTYHRVLSIGLSCQYGRTDCHSEAVQYFDLWIVDPSDRYVIEPDVRPMVYCYGLQYHPEHEAMWQQVLQVYQLETHSSEMGYLRDALSCSNNQTVLNNLYDMCVSEDDTTIRSGDEALIVSDLSVNPLVQDYIWGRIDAEWDTIAHRETALSAIVETFSTDEDATQLSDFMERHPAQSDDEQAFYDTLNLEMSANQRWRAANYDDMTAWLQRVAQTTAM